MNARGGTAPRGPVDGCTLSLLQFYYYLSRPLLLLKDIYSDFQDNKEREFLDDEV